MNYNYFCHNKKVQKQNLLFLDFLHNPEKMEAVAFLTDMTSHMNDLNLKLQGNGNTVCQLISAVRAFQRKLELYKGDLQVGCLTLAATHLYFIMPFLSCHFKIITILLLLITTTTTTTTNNNNNNNNNHHHHHTHDQNHCPNNNNLIIMTIFLLLCTGGIAPFPQTFGADQRKRCSSKTHCICGEDD